MGCKESALSKDDPKYHAKIIDDTDAPTVEDWLNLYSCWKAVEAPKRPKALKVKGSLMKLEQCLDAAVKVDPKQGWKAIRNLTMKESDEEAVAAKKRNRASTTVGSGTAAAVQPPTNAPYGGANDLGGSTRNRGTVRATSTTPPPQRNRASTKIVVGSDELDDLQIHARVIDSSTGVTDSEWIDLLVHWACCEEETRPKTLLVKGAYCSEADIMKMIKMDDCSFWSSVQLALEERSEKYNEFTMVLGVEKLDNLRLHGRIMDGSTPDKLRPVDWTALGVHWCSVPAETRPATMFIHEKEMKICDCFANALNAPITKADRRRSQGIPAMADEVTNLWFALAAFYPKKKEVHQLTEQSDEFQMTVRGVRYTRVACIKKGLEEEAALAGSTVSGENGLEEEARDEAKDVFTPVSAVFLAEAMLDEDETFLGESKVGWFKAALAQYRSNCGRKFWVWRAYRGLLELDLKGKVVVPVMFGRKEVKSRHDLWHMHREFFPALAEWKSALGRYLPALGVNQRFEVGVFIGDSLPIDAKMSKRKGEYYHLALEETRDPRLVKVLYAKLAEHWPTGAADKFCGLTREEAAKAGGLTDADIKKLPVPIPAIEVHPFIENPLPTRQYINHGYLYNDLRTTADG